MSAAAPRFIILSSLWLLMTVAFPHSEVHSHASDHTDIFTRILPSKWYHDEWHPVNALFKRDGDSDAQPGTAEWAAQYPPSGQMPLNGIPQPWLDALHDAEQAGLIPNITISTASNGSPVYLPSDNPDGPVICSSTWGCRMPDDIWDAPDGFVAIGFDDGPYDGSTILYDFLQQGNIPSTHFMIGTNIVNGYDLFQRAFSELKSDIAVHTWTHRLMTSLTNEIILGELAWTMQIISDLTGGRVPKYWRPPSGDSDNRVRAIAKHVLGLTQINWNKDSEDWRMNVNQVTFEEVTNNITTWYAGPHSPGLIILEHELSQNTSQAFIDTYPDIQAHGWQIESTLRLFGDSYKNAADDDGDVQQMSVIPSPSSSSSSSSSSASPSSSVTGINQVGQGAKPSASTSGSAPATTSNSNSNSNAAISPRLFSTFSVVVLFFGMLFI